MRFVVLGYLALALFDAWYTNRRIPAIGMQAECNTFIKFLARKFGNTAGIYLGVLLPTLLLLPLGLKFPKVLIYLLGCRTTLTAFQLKVLNQECH